MSGIKIRWQTVTSPAYPPWPEITQAVAVSYDCPDHGNLEIHGNNAAGFIAEHLIWGHGAPAPHGDDGCPCGWRFEQDPYADGTAYYNGNRHTHWPRHAAWVAEQHGVDITPPEVTP